MTTKKMIKSLIKSQIVIMANELALTNPDAGSCRKTKQPFQ